MKHPNPRTLIMIITLIGVFIIISVSVILHLSSPEPIAYTSDEIAEMHLERINLNTATAEELSLLPDIGATLAGRIIAYREAQGAFTSVNELLSIEGIGANAYAKIAPYVTVDQ